ncbi:MAG: hypothetical protein IT279_10110 [Ignavibacteriaceae bacterium]|nr:hypothetical protein [Ignavibacteriaceae bacterium]
MNNHLQEDEKEFEGLINQLKSLKKVDAPPGFEANLMRRINQEDYKSKQVEESFFSKIFSKLILWPAAGLAVAVIAFVLVRPGGGNEANPWTQSAIERPDVIAVSTDDSANPVPPVIDQNPAAGTGQNLASDKKAATENLPPSNDPDQDSFTSRGAASKPEFADSLKKEQPNQLMFKTSSSDKKELDSLKNRIFKKNND